MTICFEEPTVDELLGDPLIRMVMHADGVDTTALRAMFGVLTAELATRPKPAPARRPVSAMGGFLRLIAGPRDTMSGRESCFCGAR
jgi:hypothetical protein